MLGQKQTIVVIGLGTFGSTVAQDLMRFDNHVIGIDSDKARVTALADVLSQTLIVDARDDVALREVGLDGCDVGVVGIGSDIEASILAAMNLRTIGLKKIWAKASSKNHHRILSKLKVERVIHPEKEVGQQIAQILHNPLIRDYVSLGNGQYVVTFTLPDSLQGRTLADLPHRDKFDLRCIGLTRGTDFLGADGSDVTLEEGDLMLLLGERKNLRAFAGTL